MLENSLDRTLTFLTENGIALQAASTIILVGVTCFYAHLTRQQLKFHEEKDRKDFAIALILKSLEPDYLDGFLQIVEGGQDGRKIGKALSFLEVIGTAYFFEKADRDIIYDFFKIDVLKMYKSTKPPIEIIRGKDGQKDSFERFEFMAKDFQRRRDLENR